MFVNRLLKEIKRKNNPCVVGLDPTLEMMPEQLKGKYLLANTNKEVADMFWEFNKTVIDSIYDLAPCIKVQVAFYESYGLEGIEVFYKTLDYGKQKGLITIADVKRGDIGSTAAAYAKAYLRNSSIDSITVNPYFGTDGLDPFVKECKENDKGIFILVKTSNNTSAQLQDLKTEEGYIYERVAEIVKGLEDDCSGYSNIGSVIGGTQPDHLKNLRNRLKGFILVPGYGAQGATAEDIKHGFKADGYGALICSSRAITEHYKKLETNDYGKASRIALEKMIKDISR